MSHMNQAKTWIDHLFSPDYNNRIPTIHQINPFVVSTQLMDTVLRSKSPEIGHNSVHGGISAIILVETALQIINHRFIQFDASEERIETLINKFSATLETLDNVPTEKRAFIVKLFKTGIKNHDSQKLNRVITNELLPIIEWQVMESIAENDDSKILYEAVIQIERGVKEVIDQHGVIHLNLVDRETAYSDPINIMYYPVELKWSHKIANILSNPVMLGRFDDTVLWGLRLIRMYEQATFASTGKEIDRSIFKREFEASSLEFQSWGKNFADLILQYKDVMGPKNQIKIIISDILNVCENGVQVKESVWNKLRKQKAPDQNQVLVIELIKKTKKQLAIAS